ncbi:hypothetical protein J155_00737 [Xanthomonas citri pv. citri]|uniref:Uncharacterized protein n=1 Tax=Xanthomonas axonopodis pv. citri (strain 306) TaxID=190486 RepID=A0AAI8ERH8_XANAC|nr:hypothetical protein XAC0616 [Xanthomonas citri pv. citri str. 306]AJD67208.1 hypothetical protein J151_00739 [Xanthomonas citri subsp. citri A306]AJY80742.1 hypothetical protein J159_00736 [Xanthomonas citri pv. citri]AJY85164.1 hypothetical protein J158_00736 [Xanthomonas citri subsp. citri UI6]AJY89587.1 hypothetical protein J169_00735 [Xanthomonas citri pv. citri]
MRWSDVLKACGNSVIGRVCGVLTLQAVDRWPGRRLVAHGLRLLMQQLDQGIDERRFRTFGWSEQAVRLKPDMYCLPMPYAPTTTTGPCPPTVARPGRHGCRHGADRDVLVACPAVVGGQGPCSNAQARLVTTSLLAPSSHLQMRSVRVRERSAIFKPGVSRAQCPRRLQDTPRLHPWGSRAASVPQAARRLQDVRRLL